MNLLYPQDILIKKGISKKKLIVVKRSKCGREREKMCVFFFCSTTTFVDTAALFGHFQSDLASVRFK